ncbi:MAG: hypothetical protein NTZ46_07690 [Verrucomicrobia bacterium]|nr:hypothetical protein [Verrucomicrobiota bacterium]
MVIGIFGATYAALNALRTHLEPPIQQAYSTADERAEAFIKLKGEANGATGHCKKHQKNIKFWRSIWLWANAIPAVIFFTIIALLTGWVLYEWDSVTIQHSGADLTAMKLTAPWCWFRPVLTKMACANLGCVAIAIFSWTRCSASSNGLQQLRDSVSAEGLENP